MLAVLGEGVFSQKLHAALKQTIIFIHGLLAPKTE